MGKVKDFFNRVFRVAKRKKPTQPPATITGWTFFYGQPNPVMADATSFLWPASPYTEPHYMLHPHGPVTASQTISITYKIEAVSGAPVIQSTECTSTQNPAAKAALIICCGNQTTYYDRAWWITVAPMTIGTHTITAPFSSPNWTFVAAKSGPVQNPSQWAYMLANMNKIGLTFNGCSSMGHGAYCVGGTAKVTIVSVTVA
jgi:hypothetical protein